MLKFNLFNNSKFFKRINKIFIIRNSSTRIILVYNIIDALVALIFYPINLPLLNHAPGIIGSPNEGLYESFFPYWQEYIAIVLFNLLIGTLILKFTLRGTDRWEKLLSEPGEENEEEIRKIRKKYINLPYLIYIFQILIPVFSVLVITLLEFEHCLESYIYIVKLEIIVFTLFTLGGVTTLIFSKNIYRRILIYTYREEKLEGVKIGLKTKIFFQVVPMFIVALLLTSLIGYSLMVTEKGDLYFKIYHRELTEKFSPAEKIKDINQIRARLQSISFQDITGCGFFINPRGKIFTLDKSSLNLGFQKYLFNITRTRKDGRVYGYTAEVQGAVVKVRDTKNRQWIVGVNYGVVSKRIVIIFFGSFLALLTINILVLYYFAKTLADEIAMVTENLTEIAEGGGEVNLDIKLPVTSNDEIGDLVTAFNKIQDRERQHIQRIQDNQNMLMERERLASLGQLIGGIAHNLRSPIMSLSGAIEGLKDLIKEYDESVDDQNVTAEDHHEIAREMLSWVRGMQPYCSYMSDLIAAVREQVVQLNASMISNFSLDELVKRVELLMKYELLKYNCTMTIDVLADLDTVIQGEVNNLVQVCNNLIINAIQAYDNNGGLIEFKIQKQNDYVEIIVRDYGHGIPQEIQKRLFREMVTTKGKNGTGLGLYMSYLNIKGRFGGKLWFESEEAKGTIFHILLPGDRYVLNDDETIDD